MGSLISISQTASHEGISDRAGGISTEFALDYSLDTTISLAELTVDLCVRSQGGLNASLSELFASQSIGRYIL